MTCRARQRCVPLACVPENRVVELRALEHFPKAKKFTTQTLWALGGWAERNPGNVRQRDQARQNNKANENDPRNHAKQCRHGSFVFRGRSSLSLHFRSLRLNGLSLRDNVMARRRVEFADIGRVAIGANKTPVPINGSQFLAKVLPQSIFVVTFGAAGYGHVGLQTPERGCPGDVDMARRAFGDVVLLFTATFMTKLN